MIKAKAEHSVRSRGVSCATIACLANMFSVIWLRLVLCNRYRYLVVKAVLARIINLILSACSVFARNFKPETGCFLRRCIATFIPVSIVVLHINMIARFPKESAIIIV